VIFVCIYKVYEIGFISSCFVFILFKMDSEEEKDKIIRPPVKTQKSVQIVEPEIIEVREKHGPLYKAIPKMPIPLAIFCCLLNIFLPGIGELADETRYKCRPDR